MNTRKELKKITQDRVLERFLDIYNCGYNDSVIKTILKLIDEISLEYIDYDNLIEIKESIEEKINNYNNLYKDE